MLHPIPSQLDPAFAFGLDTVAVGAGGFCSGKAKAVTAYWINMQLCRNIQCMKCLEKQQGILYRNGVIRSGMPQESRRCILADTIFQR